jgi:hypothetical protein
VSTDPRTSDDWPDVQWKWRGFYPGEEVDDPRTLADRLRNMVRNPNAIGTHSEACWQWHDDCALLLAAALLRDLADERDALADEVMRHQAGESCAVGYEYGVATAAKFKAERDELRAELDRILDAIGDLSGGWTVREGEMILDRIADAVDDIK